MDVLEEVEVEELVDDEDDELDDDEEDVEPDVPVMVTSDVLGVPLHTAGDSAMAALPCSTNPKVIATSPEESCALGAGVRVYVCAVHPDGLVQLGVEEYPEDAMMPPLGSDSSDVSFTETGLMLLVMR